MDGVGEDYRRRAFAEEPVELRRAANELATTSTTTLQGEAGWCVRLYPLQEPRTKQDVSKAVVVHLDLDCFYAQVEELLDPSLKGKPVGVTQKYLVVTCNYEARKAGITKLMNVKEAMRKCPSSLVLRSGEDLTPYRSYSRKAEALLQKFGPVERLGLDEFFVDVQALVDERLAAGEVPQHFRGHLVGSGTSVRADTRFRPQDLRSGASSGTLLDLNPPVGAEATEEERRLAVGSVIAATARGELRQLLGLRASAGITVNKLLSKLVGGLHKPDDQTTMLFKDADLFTATLPVRCIKGVGALTEQKFKSIGVHTCLDLRAKTVAEISKSVTKGNQELAKFFHLCSWGIDLSRVVPKGPPKTVSVEDSFKSLEGYEATMKVLKSVLVPDLLTRLREDCDQHQRRPVTLTVTYRTMRMREKKHFARKSLSCAFPRAMDTPEVSEACLALLRKGLGGEAVFAMTLLNIGASRFTDFKPETGSRRPTTSVATFKAFDVRDGRRIADGLTMKRRNYGKNPSLLLSKQQTRTLASTGEIPEPAESRATPSSLPSIQSHFRSPGGRPSQPAAGRRSAEVGLGIDMEILKEMPEDVQREYRNALGSRKRAREGQGGSIRTFFAKK
ncbi:DNA polymerase iota [Chloropicon primus]|nr:DNA polymerase iota [Chloropicon primus]